MKVIRLYAIKDLRLEEVPKPSATENHVFLRTASVGVCSSDIHYFPEDGTGGLHLESPLILGHEFSAWIEEGPQKSQLVAVDPALPCGTCEFCLEGNPNLCLDIKFAGAEETQGSLREYLTWPKEAVYPLPKGFSPEEGAMLEPLGVAIHALRLGKVFPGMDVGIFGAGPIGLLTIQMAKLAGAAVETAVQTAKYGATTVLIGIPTEDETHFTASSTRRRGLTIKLARRMKNTYPTAIQLVARGMINLQPLITDRFPFGEFNQAFAFAANPQGVKVFINFDG